MATNSKHVGFRVEHTHRSAKALCFKVFCFKAFNPTKHTFRCATKSVCVMPTIQIVAFEYAAMDNLSPSWLAVPEVKPWQQLNKLSI